MSPILSIITPVLNNEKFISQAIDNYISEATLETELIIVDGGSKDNTVEIIKKYASQRSDIRWISEKDSGQSDAMNKGIRLSEGEYLSFLNVDDYYSKGTLKEVISILKSNSNINFLVGNCNVWDQNDKLVFINKPDKLKKWHVLSGNHFPVNPTAYFYKKELHEIISYYKEDNHYNMDLEFIIQARLYTDFNYLNCVWGNFRMLPNTKTFTDLEQDLLEKRKKELLNKYFKKISFYLKIRVLIYSLSRRIKPELNLFIRRLKEKFLFEIKK